MTKITTDDIARIIQSGLDKWPRAGAVEMAKEIAARLASTSPAPDGAQLIEILYDISAGRKNKAGDYWSLDYVKQAADYIAAQQSVVEKGRE